jgi:hypothetical protein
MSHPFPAYLKVGYFNAAAVADNALIPDRLELAAVALPLLCGSEDPFAKKAVLLGPERPVVDCFRLFDFPV